MGIIQQLNEQLINQIAAGEVIERPASVVKELLENAIDADSTEIEIQLFDGGLKRIEIHDNGSGMPEKDLKICTLRHTTSKLLSSDDLFAIKTLGFRGEALASIASVSHLTVVSCDGVNKGNVYDAKEDKIVAKGRARGTTVVVRELFYNTPARKKYMRTETTELRRCTEVVQAYALAYPNIGFVLKHNAVTLLNVAPTEQYNRIVDILGKEVGRHMIPLEAESFDPSIQVTGYIGKPDVVRKDKRLQLFFVNKRLISNAAISVALKRGFEGMIHHDTYPVALLHIQVQPQKIDVNVHPTKSQVRFEDEQTLFKVVYHCTKETLRANQLMRDVDVAPMQKKLTEESVSVVQPALATYHVSDSSQEVLDKKEEYVTTESSKLPSLRVLGLVHNKFIIAETDTDMLLVDFHAAHERINYEKLKEKYSKEGVKIQQLVTPAVLEVDVALVAGFQKRKDLLGTLGFLVEEFGKNSLLIRSVPSIFGQQMKPDMVIELLEYAMENKKNPIDKIKDDMLARMACRMSYMAGDELTFPQMKTIINDLHELDIAYSCPHGRPIIVKFSDTELDKLFERRM